MEESEQYTPDSSAVLPPLGSLHVADAPSLRSYMRRGWLWPLHRGLSPCRSSCLLSLLKRWTEGPQVSSLSPHWSPCAPGAPVSFFLLKDSYVLEMNSRGFESQLVLAP